MTRQECNVNKTDIKRRSVNRVNDLDKTNRHKTETEGDEDVRPNIDGVDGVNIDGVDGVNIDGVDGVDGVKAR